MKIVKTISIICAITFSLLLNGQNQKALKFDGTDDWVDCGSDASLDIKGPITIEAWVYLNGPIGIYKRFVEKDWKHSYYFGGKYGINGAAFGMDPDSIQANILETPNYSLPEYTWTHIVGWWDGALLKIYINGEEAASKPWVKSVVGSWRSVKIGKYYQPPENLLNGNLDEIRIWSEARTVQQIRDNMYRELPNPASEPNLVAYYRMNEGSGQTIEDLSANNNTGYLGGTAAVEPSDPLWIASTAPIPYYTVTNGDWNSDATWENYQLAPNKDWARVDIRTNVHVSNDVTALEVNVDKSGQLTVDNGFSMNVTGDFRVKSTTSGTGSFINYGSFSYANAIIERFYPGNEWHLISSPITDALSGLFLGLYLQEHSEAMNQFSDIIPVDIPLNPGEGYAIWNYDNATAEFNGILNEGTISRELTRSGAGNNYGWNLMGNPYCSSINWDAAGWTKVNVNNAIYIHVNSATWAMYVAGVGINGGSKYIAPGQGYFVMVSDDGSVNGTLESTDAVRAHYNTQFFKSEVSDLVLLELAGNGYNDETAIRFIADATPSFDGEYDAVKLYGNVAAAAQIYSLSSQAFSIQALPETDKINLGYKTGEEGSYTIAASVINDLPYVILEDTETGETKDLLTGNYPFQTSSGTFDNRFVLHFKPLATSFPLAEIVKIYTYDSKVYISGMGNRIGNIEIYNIIGQLIKSVPAQTAVNGIEISETGNYIVRVVSDSNIMTRKICIR
jgi:hypothetical protein